jgi:hypothetical protein
MRSSDYQRQLERSRRLSKYMPPDFDPLAQPGTYSRDYYLPNSVPLLQRIAYACLAVALLGYGAIGVLVDALWIPGRRTTGLVLAGIPAWLALASLCVGAIGLFSVVIDHYDRRNNERHYRRLQSASRVLSLAILVVAGAWHIWPLFGRLLDLVKNAA